MASNEQVIKDIRYYQQRLESYVANKNDAKVLYAISKLSKLPINTVHLEDTGVGRSVNALKKYGGEVSKAAKELVTFWKEMVLREDKSQEEVQVEPGEVDSVYSSEHEMEVDSAEENSESNSSKREDSTNKIDSVENVNCDINNEYTVNRHQKCDSKNQDGLGTTKNNSNKPQTSRSHGHKTEYSKNNVMENKSRKRSHTSENRHDDGKEKYKSKKSRHDGIHTSLEHKLESHQDIRDSTHKSRSDTTEKNERKKSDSKKEKEYKYPHSESISYSDKKETKSKSSTSEKHCKHDEVKSDSKKSIELYNSENKQDKIRWEKHSKISKEHKTEKNRSKGESDKKYEKNMKGEVDPPTKKIINGIGSDSGTSFAEALGMCEPTVSKKKLKVSKSKTSSDNKVVSPVSHSKTRSDVEDLVPEPLREPQLLPLNISISSLLPEITPNYKPLVFDQDYQQKRLISDDEALSRVMSNRNQRTKVYSGNKTITKVDSLFQICIKVLQDNIDSLEYTGGVPYLILKPILEKANPDQLFNMEHHNPYLIEDTDELWKLHCQREFKTKKRQELETWREMYMRCLDEREARLNFITANIKQSQDKSLPVRTTKLAYVDSFVKPPRNIARQQAKHGTSRPSTATKLVALAKSGEAGKVSVPNPGSRAAERSSSWSSATSNKVKKAPLMAKALSIMKNRFKK